MEKQSPPPDFWRWIELSRVHKFAGSMLIVWPCSALSPAVRHDDLTNMGKLAWGMTMAARPLSLSVHTYATNLAYGLVGAALLHR
jgi:4-hydroxybenzoate polyprenyltransferase